MLGIFVFERIVLIYLHLSKNSRTYAAEKVFKIWKIMKGNKFLPVSRRFVEGKDYYKMFIKRYLK